MGESERATTDVDAPPAAARGAGARTVLVVVDDENIRGLVQSALRVADYDVLTASDGREALRTVYGQSWTPALLLTDIELPGMGGVELAARLTAERPGMRVLLMTGRPDSVAPALDRALVSGVLLKPFTSDEVRSAVGRVLERGHG
jgi:two-component system cell cycle sensor histidine kinase/response regulator CckA